MSLAFGIGQEEAKEVPLRAEGLPLGYIRLKRTVSRKAILYYRCASCSQEVFSDFEAIGEASYIYHFLNRHKELKAQAEVLRKSMEAVEKNDIAMYQAINVDHNYEVFTSKIICPYCEAQQPWSDVPKRFEQTSSFSSWLAFSLVWGVPLACIVLWGVFSLLGQVMAGTCSLGEALGRFGTISLWLTPFLFFPLFNVMKRWMVFDGIKDSHFEPPIYYNRKNYDELLERVRKFNEFRLDKKTQN